MIDHKSFRKLVTELKLYGISVSQSIENLKMIVQVVFSKLKWRVETLWNKSDDWSDFIKISEDCCH